MNDYWNDPPEDREPPTCCEEYMEVMPDGACFCAICGKRIDPQLDFGSEDIPIDEESPLSDTNVGNQKH